MLGRPWMNLIIRQCLELPPISQPRGFFIQAGLICSYDYNNNNIGDKQLSYSVVLIPYLSHKSRKFKIHMFSCTYLSWSRCCRRWRDLNYVTFPGLLFPIKACFFVLLLVAVFSRLIRTTPDLVD